MITTKTWMITGASKGIGFELANLLLSSGHNVIATSRSVKSLNEVFKVPLEGFLPLEVDLQSEESIAAAVAKGIEHFRQIDCLVNNAGYGLLGGIEESSKKEVQENFDVNVFGLLNVTRAVLPYMRKAGTGHIFNLSSVFGLIAGAGWGIYCATKFAVEGLSEALQQEVQPFGIKVTIIEPGYFRTNFLESGSLITSKNAIGEYTEIAEIKRKHVEEIPGSQPGDPRKAALVMLSLASLENPPLRLLLGSDALQYAEYKIGNLQAEIAAYRATTLSTDFA
jgi:short-subunit dehydrogenase